MKSLFTVTSTIHGDHSAYRDFSSAQKKVGELNKELFDEIVYQPLQDLDFVCTQKFERMLNDQYLIESYSIES